MGSNKQRAQWLIGACVRMPYWGRADRVIRVRQTDIGIYVDFFLHRSYPLREVQEHAFYIRKRPHLNDHVTLLEKSFLTKEVRGHELSSLS